MMSNGTLKSRRASGPPLSASHCKPSGNLFFKKDGIRYANERSEAGGCLSFPYKVSATVPGKPPSRDGGLPGTVAETLYGKDRQPPASLRSLAYLMPSFLKNKLPEGLQWLAERGGPLARRDFKVPFDI